MAATRNINIIRDKAGDIEPGAYTPGRYPPDTTRRPFNWRVVLLCVGVVALLLACLFIALWRFLSYKYQYDQNFAAFVDGSLYVAIGALVLTLAGACYALVASLVRWARRAGLVDWAGGYVVEASALRGLNLDTLSARHTAIEIAYANNSILQRATNVSNINIPQLASAPAIEGEVVDSGPQLLALTEWMPWFDTRPHGLLAAETGGGKSTLFKAIAKSRIERGELLFLLDPHSSDWFGLPAIGGGEDWNAVWCGMQVVIAEYKARLAERDAYLQEYRREKPIEDFKRITVLLDEANTACLELSHGTKRGEKSKWDQFALALGSGARKVGISVQLLAQSPNVEDLELSGPMLNNFTRICLDARTSHLLINQGLNATEEKRELARALEGQAYPAATTIKGKVVLLDRAGLDQIGQPSNPRAALWAEGYERAGLMLRTPQIGAQHVTRSVVSASSRAAESARVSIPVPSADAQTRQTVQTVLMSDRVRVYLKAYANQGLTRIQAREKMETRGLKFDNGLWTEVRRELGLSE